jgi:ABC-type uncharacterized transport system ATPase subunit
MLSTVQIVQQAALVLLDDPLAGVQQAEKLSFIAVGTCIGNQMPCTSA